MRLPLLLGTFALALGCAHGRAGGDGVPGRGAELRAAAQQLMSACWPSTGHTGESVRLTFTREGGALANVEFEARGGAPNAVGRCLAHVAWRFPWEGRFPELLDALPPLAPPNGWTHLAHVALLSDGTYPPERGVTLPGPLVRACLEGRDHRRSLRWRVQPQPLRVTPFVQSVAGGEVQTDAQLPRSDAERCVLAVLASTVFPATRVLELEFADLSSAPAPAQPAEVAWYFPPPEPVRGVVDSAQVQPAMLALQGGVARCWEQALLRRASLYGGRSLRLRVGADGAVTHATVIDNESTSVEEAADYLLDHCLVDAVRKVRLPAPVGGPGDVTYSWVFEHR